MKRILYTLFIVLFLVIVGTGFACSTFVLKNESGQLVFGRNFDFPVGSGHVQINLRGQKKTAFVRPPENPMEWISKYGSISFNQIGREFPYGGMNEAGLVIEQMWLQETTYPEHDQRFGLTELQWIQYQLDNSATVDEVISTDDFLRISYTSMATLHFLVADKEGNIATIEYIDGKMTSHKGKDLPFPVLTNCTYEVSIDYFNNKIENTGKTFSGWTENSSGRFTIAAEMIDEYNGQDVVDYSFEILEKVSQPGATQWSIVYNVMKGSIFFNTIDNKNLRSVSLLDFDFSCDGQNICADMHPENDTTLTFVEYNPEENLKLLNAVCEGVELLSQMPLEIRKMQSYYPMEINCSE